MLDGLVETLSLKVPPAPLPPAKQETQIRPLQEAIRLEVVSFIYPGASNPAISGAQFAIYAGERIGILGQSGSGKSTLMDLLLGLQVPTDGRILVDGVELGGSSLEQWRRKVAHVPQAIFLADSSIADNIAFGVPSGARDWSRIEDAARRAHLMEFVDQLPDGLETIVGERGTRLSGGQRQRIGIARALYKQATVLVLDEATSALDLATEEEVNSAIRALDRSLTIVVVSHRTSGLAMCDRWFRLDHGTVHEVPRPTIEDGIAGGLG